MTTIATPPAAALDALLDRLSAGKPLTADEAALLRAGVTGLRRTAGGLQRRSQQQAARISELESEKERAIRWAVHLEGDQRRQEVRADEAHERARVATVAALNLQQQTPDKAHRTLDRIRKATSWSAVWIELGRYFGLSAVQAGAEARSRRIGEVRTEQTEEELRARIAELEADAQAVLKREAIAQLAATARAEYVAEQGETATPAEEIALHAMGLGYRLDAAEATLARVRLYADLLALADMTSDAREVARIVLDVLDGKEPAEAAPPTAHPQHLRDRLAAAIRSATCPGECDDEETCRRTRFQPTVWDESRVAEVVISGPPERIAAVIIDALGEAQCATS